MEGKLRWVDALPKDPTPSETDADAYITRTSARDPDLWVIEIEDRNGANPFDPK